MTWISHFTESSECLLHWKLKSFVFHSNCNLFDYYYYYYYSIRSEQNHNIRNMRSEGAFILFPFLSVWSFRDAQNWFGASCFTCDFILEKKKNEQRNDFPLCTKLQKRTRMSLSIEHRALELVIKWNVCSSQNAVRFSIATDNCRVQFSIRTDQK